MGYEIARIVSEIDDRFLCPICTMVLENPMQSLCEHKFCNDCIIEWIKDQTSCPVDSCSLALDNMKPPPRYFRNLLEKFEIKCTFEPTGCETVVSLKQLQCHLTECAFNPNREVICGNGCNIKITRLSDEVGRQQKLITKLNAELSRSRCEVWLSTNVIQRQQEEITELRGEVDLQREEIEEIMKFVDEVVQQEDITKLTDEINGQPEEITKLNNELQESCGRAESLPSIAMRGILDLDVLCFKKIFKFVNQLDLCSLRQSCTQLQNFVDDHFHSLYFAREQWLDLRAEDMRNVKRILSNFGRLVGHLKVREQTRRPNLLLDVILTNCGATLKGLSLNDLQLNEIDVEKFTLVFDNLEVLELIDCDGNQKCIEQFLLGHEYAKLTTLKVKSYVGREILKKFFMRPRNIKKLSCDCIIGNTLPLIVRNASEIEELAIFPRDDRNLMSLVQLRKLKRLKIQCRRCDQRWIIALIKELSVNNQLEMLGMYYFEFTEEFCDALNNLTNLKELRLWNGRCTLNGRKPLELDWKLSKLESLVLAHCSNFPYRNFLASACKSDKFRTFYVWADWREINNCIEQTVKDFIQGRGHRCFVSGDALCIYLEGYNYSDIKRLLTEDNFQSIEKFGNIKILRANDDVSWFGF